MATGCLQVLDDGVLVPPPRPSSVPPVMVKVLLSQSNPSSGCVVPMAMAVPPLMVSVPLESMPSLLLA
jgi:hypothetical protein